MIRLRFAIGVFWTLFVSAVSSRETTVELNRDIRLIFSDKCYTCHGPDAANRKTKLWLDLESGVKIEIGKGWAAIVPGDAAASEIYRRITSENQAVRMPSAYVGRE